MSKEETVIVPNPHRAVIYCTECDEVIVGTPIYDINGYPYHNKKCMCKGKNSRISEINRANAHSAVRCPDPNLQETYRLWKRFLK